MLYEGSAYSSPLINVMCKAVLAASKHMKRDFGEIENLQVSSKGPRDFVTSTDKRSEFILKQELKKARPSFGFLTEESGESPGHQTTAKWIIDPLDGTVNFMHSCPFFCISVALQVENEFIAGVIYDPLREELFWAEKGRGAFLNNRRLYVSKRRYMADALIGALLPMSPVNLGEFEAFQKLRQNTQGVRHLGATSLSLAYVAMGRLDGFWHQRVTPWDVAAGIVLIKEAGGVVVDSSYQSFGSQSINLLATNSYLKASLAEHLWGWQDNQNE